MAWQFSAFSVVMIVSTFAGLLAAMVVWERRVFRGGYALTFMMLAVAEWSLTQAVEVSITDVATKIFLSKLSYLGIVSVPALLFLFTARYLQNDTWLTKRSKFFLWLVPVLTFFLVMTNEWHYLVWNSFTTRIISGNISVVYGHGIWFWVIATFIYLVSFVSAFLLLQVAYRMYDDNRSRTILLVIAAVLPGMANILYLLGFGWFNVLDFTPVAFTVTGAILVYVLFDFQMFGYIPVLRNVLVDKMSDGILVLDGKGKVIDINDSAIRLFGVTHKNPTGRQIEELIGNRQVLECIQQPGTDRNRRQRIEIEPSACILDIQSIAGHGSLAIDGRLLLIRDITCENRTQRELQEKKDILDVIFDGVPAMIGYVDEQKRYLAVNKPYADWYHLKKEDIVGRHIGEILTDPAAFRKAEQNYEEVLQGKYVSFENIVQVGDEQKIVDVKYVPHFGDDNRVKAFFALIQDITERKQIEETEAKARKLAEAIRNAGMAMISSLDYEQVLLLILEQISTVVSLDSAAVLMLQDEQMNMVAVKGCGQESDLVGSSYRLADSPVENLVINEKRVVNSLDVPAEYPSLIKPPFETMRSWLGVPLLFKDDVIGMLSLGNESPEHFSAEDERVVAVFAGQVAVALENARVFEKMKQMATIDMLTGLSNRRHLFVLGEREFERSLRYDKELSLVMMDLDHFKAVNDRYGHKAGDLVLQTIARKCHQTQRKVDIIGRYGGEEFVFILPETDITNAAQTAERLRYIIQETEVMTQSGSIIHVTASLGVVQRSPRASSFEGMLDMADYALYTAKKLGRNRVEVYNDRLTKSI